MRRGVILTAYMNGNPPVPYGELAILAASMIRRRLGDVPISLFVDDAAQGALEKHHYRLPTLFTDITVDNLPHTKNLRRYPGSEFTENQFNNSNRCTLYDRVLYDEMLIIDTDYLLYESSLNEVWGSYWPIRMNRKISSIRYPATASVERIGGITIPLYWATVGYFRRCPETDRFFRIVEYVRANYAWFARIYQFSSYLYRNDFVYSIAFHLLGGQCGQNLTIGDLPNDTLRFAWENDRVIGYNSNGLWFSSELPGESTLPIYHRDQSIHVLNKVSLAPYLERMISHEWKLLGQ